MACGDNEEITVVDFRWAEWVCIAAILSRSCSLWVKKRTSEQVRVMSALPPKADIGSAGRDDLFVPKAEIHGLFDHRMESSGQFPEIRCREKRGSLGQNRKCVRESRKSLPASVRM